MREFDPSGVPDISSRVAEGKPVRILLSGYPERLLISVLAESDFYYTELTLADLIDIFSFQDHTYDRHKRTDNEIDASLALGGIPVVDDNLLEIMLTSGRDGQQIDLISPSTDQSLNIRPSELKALLAYVPGSRIDEVVEPAVETLAIVTRLLQSRARS